MKPFLSTPITVSGCALLLALAWLAPGCASSSSDTSAPRPGSGIAEYREVAREAHRAVTAAVKSLEALARPHTQTTAPHPALPGFDFCGDVHTWADGHTLAVDVHVFDSQR